MTKSVIISNVFQEIIDILTIYFMLMSVFPKINNHLLIGFYIIIYIRSFICLIMGFNKFKIDKVNLILVLIFSFIFLLSSIWSYDFSLTFKSSLYFLGTTIFAIYLVNRYEKYKIIKLISSAIFISSILSIILAIFVPTVGLFKDPRFFDKAWRGVFMHRNHLGLIMSLGIVISMYSIKEGIMNKKFCILSLILYFVNLIYSKSSTGVLVLFLLVILILFSKFNSIIKCSLIIVVSLLIIVLNTDKITFLNVILDIFQRDSTFTGRSQIWQLSLISAKLKPLLGYGYEAFWTPSESIANSINAELGWMVPSAHNGFIDMFLSVGLIGSIFYYFMLIKSIIRSKKCLLSKNIYIIILIFITLYNFSESYLTIENTLIWVIQVVAFISLD